jgi:hypothetical protein
MTPVEFRDATGAVIDYGNRWGMDSPPDDTYSVTSNLERFRPLHAVADALVAWLVETFDVAVTDDPEAVAQSIGARIPASRAVRLDPADASAAALTLVFTDFPGVVLHAGVTCTVHLPPCGCDACDETWQNGAEELEFTVRAVVGGGFSESIAGRARPTFHYQLDVPGVGTRGMTGSPGADWTAERIAAARDRLSGSRSWSPWSARS